MKGSVVQPPKGVGHERNRKTIQPVLRRATQGWLSGTFKQAGPEHHHHLSIYGWGSCRQHWKNRTLTYRTTCIHLHCTQEKWELEKKNTYVLNRILARTPPWHLTFQWGELYKKGGKWKRKAQVQLTWSNLFTSLDSRFTIWPVVVLPMAVLLRRSAYNKGGKDRIIFWCWHQATLRK